MDSYKKLTAITQGIVGQVCHNIWWSADDQAHLEFGRQVSICSQHPHLSGTLLYEWRLWDRGTPWELLSSSGQLVASTNDSPEVYRREIEKVQGARVSRFRIHPHTHAFAITFDIGLTMKLDSCWENDPTDELPCWVLFTPGYMVLVVCQSKNLG